MSRCFMAPLATALLLFTPKTSLARLDQESLVHLPARPDKASCATPVLQHYDKLNSFEREKYLSHQILRGNVPEHLKQLVPVQIAQRDGSGKLRRLKIFVMPDYLSVGCESDFIRVPLRPDTAQKIANNLGMMLPTTKLVDEIYKQAQVKLTPSPLPPSRQMVKANYIMQHDRGIRKDLGSKDLSSILIAGHKKDIVLTERLLRRPNQVAIYGWHRSPFRVIQPLSLVHDKQYLDYSHGVRLIAQTAYLDGKKVLLSDVLRDPNLTMLIQDESRKAPPQQLAYR